MDQFKHGLEYVKYKAFPSYIKELGPNLIEVFGDYVDWMSEPSNSGYIISHLSSEQDIDESVEAYKTHMVKKLLAQFPDMFNFTSHYDASIYYEQNLKTLLKNIFFYYNGKSSIDAYLFLFHTLFNTNIKITYPGDQMLILDDGRYVSSHYISFMSPVYDGDNVEEELKVNQSIITTFLQENESMFTDCIVSVEHNTIINKACFLPQLNYLTDDGDFICENVTNDFQGCTLTYNTKEELTNIEYDGDIVYFQDYKTGKKLIKIALDEDESGVITGIPLYEGDDEEALKNDFGYAFQNIYVKTYTVCDSVWNDTPSEEMITKLKKSIVNFYTINTDLINDFFQIKDEIYQLELNKNEIIDTIENNIHSLSYQCYVDRLYKQRFEIEIEKEYKSEYAYCIELLNHKVNTTIIENDIENKEQEIYSLEETIKGSIIDTEKEEIEQEIEEHENNITAYEDILDVLEKEESIKQEITVLQNEYDELVEEEQSSKTSEERKKEIEKRKKEITQEIEDLTSQLVPEQINTLEEEKKALDEEFNNPKTSEERRDEIRVRLSQISAELEKLNKKLKILETYTIQDIKNKINKENNDILLLTSKLYYNDKEKTVITEKTYNDYILQLETYSKELDILYILLYTNQSLDRQSKNDILDEQILECKNKIIELEKILIILNTYSKEKITSEINELIEKYKLLIKEEDDPETSEWRKEQIKKEKEEITNKISELEVILNVLDSYTKEYIEQQISIQENKIIILEQQKEDTTEYTKEIEKLIAQYSILSAEEKEKGIYESTLLDFTQKTTHKECEIINSFSNAIYTINNKLIAINEDIQECNEELLEIINNNPQTYRINLFLSDVLLEVDHSNIINENLYYISKKPEQAYADYDEILNEISQSFYNFIDDNLSNYRPYYNFYKITNDFYNYLNTDDTIKEKLISIIETKIKQLNEEKTELEEKKKLLYEEYKVQLDIITTNKEKYNKAQDIIDDNKEIIEYNEEFIKYNEICTNELLLQSYRDRLYRDRFITNVPPQEWDGECIEKLNHKIDTNTITEDIKIQEEEKSKIENRIIFKENKISILENKLQSTIPETEYNKIIKQIEEYEYILDVLKPLDDNPIKIEERKKAIKEEIKRKDAIYDSLKQELSNPYITEERKQEIEIKLEVLSQEILVLQKELYVLEQNYTITEIKSLLYETKDLLYYTDEQGKVQERTSIKDYEYQRYKSEIEVINDEIEILNEELAVINEKIYKLNILLKASIIETQEQTIDDDTKKSIKETVNAFELTVEKTNEECLIIDSIVENVYTYNDDKTAKKKEENNELQIEIYNKKIEQKEYLYNIEQATRELAKTTFAIQLFYINQKLFIINKDILLLTNDKNNIDQIYEYYVYRYWDEEGYWDDPEYQEKAQQKLDGIQVSIEELETTYYALEKEKLDPETSAERIIEIEKEQAKIETQLLSLYQQEKKYYNDVEADKKEYTKILQNDIQYCYDSILTLIKENTLVFLNECKSDSLTSISILINSYSTNEEIIDKIIYNISEILDAYWNRYKIKLFTEESKYYELTKEEIEKNILTMTKRYWLSIDEILENIPEDEKEYYKIVDNKIIIDSQFKLKIQSLITIKKSEYNNIVKQIEEYEEKYQKLEEEKQDPKTTEERKKEIQKEKETIEKELEKLNTEKEELKEYIAELYQKLDIDSNLNMMISNIIDAINAEYYNNPSNVNWESSKGRLNTDARLQDGEYQIYSYIINTHIEMKQWKDLILKLIHPAGLRLLAEYTNDPIEIPARPYSADEYLLEMKSWNLLFHTIMNYNNSFKIESNNFLITSLEEIKSNSRSTDFWMYCGADYPNSTLGALKPQYIVGYMNSASVLAFRENGTLINPEVINYSLQQSNITLSTESIYKKYAFDSYYITFLTLYHHRHPLTGVVKNDSFIAPTGKEIDDLRQTLLFFENNLYKKYYEHTDEYNSSILEGYNNVRMEVLKKVFNQLYQDIPTYPSPLKCNSCTEYNECLRFDYINDCYIRKIKPNDFSHYLKLQHTTQSGEDYLCDLPKYQEQYQELYLESLLRDHYFVFVENTNNEIKNIQQVKHFAKHNSFFDPENKMVYIKDVNPDPSKEIENPDSIYIVTEHISFMGETPYITDYINEFIINHTTSINSAVVTKIKDGVQKNNTIIKLDTQHPFDTTNQSVVCYDTTEETIEGNKKIKFKNGDVVQIQLNRHKIPQKIAVKNNEYYLAYTDSDMTNEYEYYNIPQEKTYNITYILFNSTTKEIKVINDITDEKIIEENFTQYDIKISVPQTVSTLSHIVTNNTLSYIQYFYYYEEDKDENEIPKINKEDTKYTFYDITVRDYYVENKEKEIKEWKNVEILDITEIDSLFKKVYNTNHFLKIPEDKVYLDYDEKTKYYRYRFKDIIFNKEEKIIIYPYSENDIASRILIERHDCDVQLTYTTFDKFCQPITDDVYFNMKDLQYVEGTDVQSETSDSYTIQRQYLSKTLSSISYYKIILPPVVMNESDLLVFVDGQLRTDYTLSSDIDNYCVTSNDIETTNYKHYKYLNISIISDTTKVTYLDTKTDLLKNNVISSDDTAKESSKVIKNESEHEYLSNINTHDNTLKTNEEYSKKFRRMKLTDNTFYANRTLLSTTNNIIEIYVLSPIDYHRKVIRPVSSTDNGFTYYNHKDMPFIPTYHNILQFSFYECMPQWKNLMGKGLDRIDRSSIKFFKQMCLPLSLDNKLENFNIKNHYYLIPLHKTIDRYIKAADIDVEKYDYSTIENVDKWFNKNNTLLFNDKGELISPTIIDWSNLTFTESIKSLFFLVFTLYSNKNIFVEKMTRFYHYKKQSLYQSRINDDTYNFMDMKLSDQIEMHTNHDGKNGDIFDMSINDEFRISNYQPFDYNWNIKIPYTEKDEYSDWMVKLPDDEKITNDCFVFIDGIKFYNYYIIDNMLLIKDKYISSNQPEIVIGYTGDNIKYHTIKNIRTYKQLDIPLHIIDKHQILVFINGLVSYQWKIEIIKNKTRLYILEPKNNIKVEVYVVDSCSEYMFYKQYGKKTYTNQLIINKIINVF